MTAAAPTMNSDELVKLRTGMMGLIWNCSIGLAMIRRSAALVLSVSRPSGCRGRGFTASHQTGRISPRRRLASG